MTGIKNAGDILSASDDAIEDMIRALDAEIASLDRRRLALLRERDQRSVTVERDRLVSALTDEDIGAMVALPVPVPVEPPPVERVTALEAAPLEEVDES